MQASINFHLQNPLEGYRRLTLMMLDADIVVVSPSSVWRVPGKAGSLGGPQPPYAESPALEDTGGCVAVKGGNSKFTRSRSTTSGRRCTYVWTDPRYSPIMPSANI